MSGKKGGGGYAGKIRNTGSQVVEAPKQNRGDGKKNVVKTGKDLRSGK